VILLGCGWIVHPDREHLWIGAFSFFVATSWLYTAICSITRPTPTPPFDMFALYLILLAGGILQLGGVLVDHSVLSTPLPSALAMIALIANLLSVLALLAVTVRMPLAVPSNNVDSKDIVIRISSSHILELIRFVQGHSVSPEEYALGMDHVWLDPPARRTRELFF
jgi:hypothetical protein